MTIRLLGALLVAIASSTALAQTDTASISVEVSGAVANPGSFTFEPGARLNNAAVAAQVSSQAWFLGAALLRNKAIEPQQRLKAGVLFELGANRVYAQAEENTALGELVDRLYSSVQAMPVTGRVVAELDPLQQLLIANNSLLESGDRLIYPRRPDQVRVTGAVAEDCVLPHDAAWQLTDYLKQCPAHKIAERSIAYVIQPNGSWNTYGIAYWNHQPAEVSVGAIIYLPLRTSGLAPATTDLNEDMARMLATQYQLGGRFNE